MKRAALWLAQEVGVGGVFTKEQLRSAFPGVSQIDRRVRDLRAEGWVIHTHRDDVTLLRDEHRLVAVGGHVWEARYASSRSDVVSAKRRQAIFAADEYTCAACGIAAGETYQDDTLRKARLSVVNSPTGAADEGVTACDRCRQGGFCAADMQEVQEALESLSVAAVERLRSWAQAGRRVPTPEEGVWAKLRRLPAERRTLLLGRLMAGERLTD